MNKIIISGNLTANPQTRLVDGASGSVSASAYTDRNNKAQASLEVNAEYIEFMSLRHEEPQEAPAPQPSPDEFMNVPDDIGEMPFN